MYNARQYEKPEGHFTEQTSRDGEKWYKVYATTRVEKNAYRSGRTRAYAV